MLRGGKFEQIFRNWCAQGPILRHLRSDRAFYHTSTNKNFDTTSGEYNIKVRLSILTIEKGDSIRDTTGVFQS